MSADSRSEHERYLARTIELARHGATIGDGGPFGSLVVRDGRILAEGWNRVIATNDPTAPPR